MYQNTLNRSFLWLFLLTASLQMLAGPGSKKEYKKQINKTFATTATGRLSVMNKYGKVQLHTWSQNQVKFDITVTVRASSDAKGKETLSKINLVFKEAPGVVEALTETAGITSNYSGGSVDYTIDYDVYMPAGNQLMLSNRYGDAFVDKLSAPAVLSIKYGNLFFSGSGNKASFNIQYGSANIGDMGNATLDISYSKVRCEKLGDMKVKSQYSEITVAQANDVSLDLEYDRFEVGNVRNVVANGSDYSTLVLGTTNSLKLDGDYTNVKITKLTSRADARMDYGEFKILTLDKNFSTVDFDGDYTDFQIVSENGGSFGYDLKSTYGEIKCAKGQCQGSDNSGTTKTVKGYVGNKSTSGARVIRVNVDYGDIKID